ncbi:MAG TPA: TIGR04283 family arsenosugar biosynthesis glycosyltransferase [Candidatus Udaeobacter sp.]|jgi:rSAM/selenodomain-associated transferase 2|nr:TIGR04283 family arsenosugar biosynthesis glycosyltransferase [Candidatus Udaeobacter sp.]
MDPWISIIIPARNDAKALRRTLSYLQALHCLESAEIIVAASGDKDETEDAVAGRGRVLWPARSTRSALMNAGAAAATGEVFFFLHADSLPPVDAFAEIRRVLRNPRIVGGAFAHRFEERAWSLRLISWINRRRYFLTRNYYGDQGIFVRAEIFRGLGGYRDLFMEDLDFSQRLKRLGRTKVVPRPVVTSGRRFLTCGPWRAFSFVVWLLLLHSLGLDTQHYVGRWDALGERNLQD